MTDHDGVVAAAEAIAESSAGFRKRLMSAGPGDALWPLKVSITRKVIAAGGVSADEIEAALQRAIEAE